MKSETMAHGYGRVRLLLALAGLTALASAQDKPGWKMIRNDEFDSPAISNAKWSLSNGASNVNSELEFYSNSPNNAFIDSGSLVLRSIKENVGGRNYTAAKMTTQNKGDWLYGRVEVRAKLPKGKGMWPAIWMMPTDNAYGGWPASGEMDIMELLGDNPAKVYGTIHWAANGNQQQGSSKTLSGSTFADDYHVFAYEWDVGSQRWLIDDVVYFTTTRGQPFDKRFYLILNVAVGGGWPGNPDNSTVFPNDMRVDYVRVYQKSANASLAAAAPQPFHLDAPDFKEALRIDNVTQPLRLVLRDLSGRILEDQALRAGESVSLGANLPAGIFLLDAQSGDRHFTRKVFKTP